MTVNTTRITSGPFPGNDTAESFDFDFPITSDSQIRVFETDDQGVLTELVLNTDYTIESTLVDGTITRTAGALPTGYSWYMRSNYQPTQLSDLESQGGFFPDVHEAAFDKLTILMQQLQDQVNRSVRLSDSDSSGVTPQLVSLDNNDLLSVSSDGSSVEGRVPNDVVSNTEIIATINSQIQTINSSLAAINATAPLSVYVISDLITIADPLNPLVITVSPFVIHDASGNPVTFAGGDVTAPANSTRYLYYDLFDGSLHLLRRNIHSGGILIADVITDSVSVTSTVIHPLKFPKTRIYNMSRKLREVNLQKTVTALIGDSLTDGSGDLPRWRNLIFDASTTPDTWKVNSAGARNIQRNFAVGGTTIDFGLAQSCRSAHGIGSLFANQQVSYYGHYGFKNVTPGTTGYGTSAMFDCDLAIISYGANGGVDRHTKLESLIKSLRANDVEVIIHTANFRTDSLDFEPIPAEIVKTLAETHGCEIADTWAYMREAHDNGEVVHADVIHPNTRGHELYAGCIRSVMHNHSVDAEYIRSDGTVLGLSSSVQSENKLFNSRVGLFTPVRVSSGALVNQPSSSTTTRDEFINPAINAGGKTADTCLTVLAEGEWADFGCSISGAVDILIDESLPFEVDVSIQNGSLVLGSASTGDGVHLGVRNVLSHGAAANITDAQPGIASRSYRVTCTSGTARIVGLVVSSPEVTEIPLADLDTVGTWNKEVGVLGVSEVMYTDTVNDRVNIPFTGTGVQVLAGNFTAGGQINIYMDGVFIEQIDLYQAFSTIRPLSYWIDNSDVSVGYGHHNLTIEYVSDNASVITPVLRNRRLGVYAAYGLDGR